MKKFIQTLLTSFMKCPEQRDATGQNTIQRKSFFIIGHRGAAGHCPENTFASFQKAIDIGVDYLEIDVQLTKDGELVVIHDPTVNRTTNGRGRVKDLTIEQIQSLDAGSWFSAQFAGERIPTLREFLDEFSGRAGILLELKKPSLYPNIEEKLANELKSRDIPNLIVQSFELQSLHRFHAIMPNVPKGLLIKNKRMGISRRKLAAFSSYVSYINPKITMVNKRLITRLHTYGFKTFVWNVRKKSEAVFLQGLSPDGIISDYPNLFPYAESLKRE